MSVSVVVDLADTDIIVSYLYTIFRIKSVVRSAMITSVAILLSLSGTFNRQMFEVWPLSIQFEPDLMLCALIALKHHCMRCGRCITQTWMDSLVVKELGRNYPVQEPGRTWSRPSLEQKLVPNDNCGWCSEPETTSERQWRHRKPSQT